MAQNFAVGQSLLFANTIKPQSDASARSGDFVTLARAHKGFFLCQAVIGSGAVTFTLQQATNTSGAGAKAFTNNARIWLVDDTTIANPVPVRQADGVAFTTTAVASNKMVIFEVDPAMLDTANGFTSATVNSGGSGAAQSVSAQFIATPRSAEDQAASPRVN